MDTAQPSTNGVSADNLFRLAALLNDGTYAARARETVNAFEVEILQYPWLFVGLLAAVVTARLGVVGVVALGDRGAASHYAGGTGDASGSAVSGEVDRMAKMPRAETRAVLSLSRPLSTWLAERNPALVELCAREEKGVFRWREKEGGYLRLG
jgi:uncharacterized protein YyaL (SSP411 family)